MATSSTFKRRIGWSIMILTVSYTLLNLPPEVSSEIQTPAALVALLVGVSIPVLGTYAWNYYQRKRTH